MNTHDLGLEPLMGVEALAEYLGVPVQTIYDWRVAGTAPASLQVRQADEVRRVGCPELAAGPPGGRR
jgi:hypothetical protein